MALKLIASYSKRLGLPEYSSHQFSVTIEAELNGADDVARESSRLYQTLQNSVDQQIQQTGFVPAKGYGNRNGQNGSSSPHKGNGHTNGNSFHGFWVCTDRQQDLIRSLIEDNHLDKAEIEAYTVQQFSGKGLNELEKAEASELIEYLINLTSPKQTRGRRPTTNGRRQ